MVMVIHFITFKASGHLLRLVYETTLIRFVRHLSLPLAVMNILKRLWAEFDVVPTYEHARWIAY